MKLSIREARFLLPSFTEEEVVLSILSTSLAQS